MSLSSNIVRARFSQTDAYNVSGIISDSETAYKATTACSNSRLLTFMQTQHNSKQSLKRHDIVACTPPPAVAVHKFYMAINIQGRPKKVSHFHESSLNRIKTRH